MFRRDLYPYLKPVPEDAVPTERGVWRGGRFLQRFRSYGTRGGAGVPFFCSVGTLYFVETPALPPSSFRRNGIFVETTANFS